MFKGVLRTLGIALYAIDSTLWGNRTVRKIAFSSGRSFFPLPTLAFQTNIFLAARFTQYEILHSKETFRNGS